jgi:predicted porin
VSNTSGSENYGGQDGANQWTANVGYYLSKRTQVYGIVSGLKNNANSVYNLASGGTSLQSTGGQSFLTYGMGMRTNF